MFDELTDRDLNRLSPDSDASAKASADQSASNKLLKQYTSEGSGKKRNFRVGRRASPLARLGAALIDYIVIGLMAAPVLAGCMFVLVPMMVDTSVLENVLENTDQMDQEQREALAAAMMPRLVMAYTISVCVAYVLPIVIYAIMITKSGKTPGKKVCGLRIVNQPTGQLPGFSSGVFLRSWVFNVLYCIPLLGAIVWLVDGCMIFAADRLCLHDRVAGTMVVES